MKIKLFVLTLCLTITGCSIIRTVQTQLAHPVISMTAPGDQICGQLKFVDSAGGTVLGPFEYCVENPLLSSFRSAATAPAPEGSETVKTEATNSVVLPAVEIKKGD